MPQNNFDLIRLFAAVQVVFVHTLIHFGYVGTDFGYALRGLDFFPGVPIFFFISGFLVTGSYERSADVWQYFKNRVLRIFPALWTCFGISILLVYISGHFETVTTTATGIAFWVFTQLSFLQFYNPDFMRSFGVGALNGSLWAIPVELQFYAMVPLLVWLFRKSVRAYFAMFIVFACINTFNSLMIIPMENPSNLAKLFQVSFLPWIVIFMLGQAAWLFKDQIKVMFEDKLGLWLIGYSLLLAVGLIFEDTTQLQVSSNNISLLWMIPLCGLVLAAAFSYKDTAHSVLRGTDISYGLYIFHMPIINFVLSQTIAPGHWGFILTLVVVVIVALASWHLVERPALRHKSSTLFNR